MSQPSYKRIEARKGQYPIAITSSTTDEVISQDIGISSETSINFAMSLNVSSVVLGAGEEILIELEEFNGTSWNKLGVPGGVLVDAGDGAYCIKLDEGVTLEALVLPLFDCIRIVVTTGATSSLTIDNIAIAHRL